MDDDRSVFLAHRLRNLARAMLVVGRPSRKIIEQWAWAVEGIANEIDGGTEAAVATLEREWGRGQSA